MPAEGGARIAVPDEAGQKEGGTVWSAAAELLCNYVEGSEAEYRAFDPRTRKKRVIHRRGTKGLIPPALLPSERDLLRSCSIPFHVCVGPVESATPQRLTFEPEGATFAFPVERGEWIGHQANRGQFEHGSVVRRTGRGGRY